MMNQPTKPLQPLDASSFDVWWSSSTTLKLGIYRQAKVDFLETTSKMSIGTNGLCKILVLVNGKKRFWLIKPALNSDKFGPKVNRYLYEKLEDKGLAPKQVAESPHFQCFEFVDGEVLEALEISSEALIDVLIQCIAQQFKASQNIAQDVLRRYPIDLEGHLRQLETEFDDSVLEQEAVSDLLKSINQKAHDATQCICHGDLNTGNIVVTQKGPIAIDWEYFGASPIEYELAMTVSINQFSPEIEARFLSKLEQLNEAIGFNEERYQLFLKLCHLINYLWVRVHWVNNANVESEAFVHYYLSSRCSSPINNLIKPNEIKGL